MWLGVLAVVVLAAGGCRGSDESTASPSTVLEPNARVVRVVDGDTLVVHIGGDDERVRLIGIDTPESVKPETPVECWGKEASATTAELLPKGTAVRLERDAEARDAYDRLLAYVRRATDGLLVNVELARRGAADALTIEPNTAYRSEIAAAVADARAAGRGLWAVCGGPHERSP